MFIADNGLMARALSNLTKLSTQLTASNYRLSTGKRINSAADDPSGLVSALNLKSQMAKIDAQVTNSNRIGSVISAADGALDEMSTLMTTVQTAVTAVAGGGLTADQIAAYQAQVDTALDGIDLLVSTTSYNGTRLLDGSINYTVTNSDTDKISDIRVHSATTSGGSAAVAITVDTQAEQALVTYAGGAFSAVTFDLTGPDGTASITLNNGDGRAALKDAINLESGTTGIVADQPIPGGTVNIYTNDYGSTASISMTITGGTAFTFDGGVTGDTGLDAAYAVNGVSATSAGNNRYKFATTTASGEFSLTDAYVALVDAGSTTGGSFSVSGNGAGWTLDSTATGRIKFGQASLATTSLGNTSLGYLSTLKSGGVNDMDSASLTTADSIVDMSLSQVSYANARLGGLKSYTIDSTINSLTDARAAMTSNLSDIEDLDYALETVENSKIQLLMDFNLQIISSLSTRASNILSLLGS